MIIIGAGPRGLAVALYALTKNIEVILIDPQPISQWALGNIVPDLQLRSPITFDLVTYLPQKEYRKYSLSNFLGFDIWQEDQKEIEAELITPSREDLFKYLNSIFNKLKEFNNFKFIQDKVLYIEDNKVKLASGKILRDKNIVCASGKSPNNKIPSIINKTKYTSKVISPRDLLNTDIEYKRLLVLGDGQGAAELADYACRRDNFVYWGLKKDYKVDRYPVPSYYLWFEKTALGNYYKTLKSAQDKKNYLKDVKTWQPSITPYILSRLLQNSNRYQTIKPVSYQDLPDYKDIDYIIPATGADNKFETFSSVVLDAIEDPNFKNFPFIKPGFKVTDYVSITGIWAIPYDGPRQGSLISAGITAKEIIDYV